MSLPGGSMDFVKPTVWADLTFEEIPTEQELKEKWRFLWEDQIGPQYDQLLELMVNESKKRNLVLTREEAIRETREVLVPPQPNGDLPYG